MVRAPFHTPAAPRKNRSEVVGNDEHDGILPDRPLAVKPKGERDALSKFFVTALT
jgi:hypothetical protein